MSLDDDYSTSDLEQDRESTNHRLYVLENSKKIEHPSELSDEYSVLYTGQDNMISEVKECEEVESRILTSPSSSDSDELRRRDQVESCNDLLDEITSASATQVSSKIHTKISLGEGVDETSNDGFQTPTKFLDDELQSNGLKCPPAPRKPKSKPLGKRKRVCRNLQVEFVNEVESALRLLINEDYQKLKKARSRGA